MALLPSYFDNIVTTLLFGKKALKFDEAITSMLMNEIRWDNNGFSNNDQVQKSLVRDEDSQEKKRKGPNVQHRMVRISIATTTAMKII